MRKLTVREAASLLNVSEKSVYRWIKQGVLPAYRINDQYRINRAELLEWATAQKIHVSPEIFAEPESEAEPPPALEEALDAVRDMELVVTFDGDALREILEQCPRLGPDDRPLNLLAVMNQEAAV